VQLLAHHWLDFAGVSPVRFLSVSQAALALFFSWASWYLGLLVARFAQGRCAGKEGAISSDRLFHAVMMAVLVYPR